MKHYSISRLIPRILFGLFLLQLIGCGGGGGCSGGSSNSQPSKDGVSENNNDDGTPTGSGSTQSVLNRINDGRNRVQLIGDQIGGRDSRGGKNGQGTGCVELDQNGIPVPCKNRQSNAISNTPLAQNNLPSQGGSNSLPSESNGASAQSYSGGNRSSDGGGMAASAGSGSSSLGADTKTAPAEPLEKKQVLKAMGDVPQAQAGGGGKGGSSSSGSGSNDYSSLFGGNSGGSAGGAAAGVLAQNYGGRAPASSAEGQGEYQFLKPEDSLFKAIERRYTQTAMSWTKEDLARP